MNQTVYKEIQAVLDGDLKILDSIYQEHREAFLAFAKRYDLAQDDILDIYQDATIAFYENVKNGKIDTLQSSIKTYLFAIAKHMIYNKLKQKNSLIKPDDELLNIADESIDFFSTINQTEQQVYLQKALNELGDSCKELILNFYYERLSIQKIATKMGYANENTVKAHKSRCMKSLRDIFMTKYAKYFQQ